MTYKLKDGPVKYAPNEQRVFRALLQNGKGMTTSAIIERVYGANAPWHARVIVNGNLHRLAKKVEANNEPFRICFSDRAGPNEILISLKPHRN